MAATFEIGELNDVQLVQLTAALINEVGVRANSGGDRKVLDGFAITLIDACKRACKPKGRARGLVGVPSWRSASTPAA